MGTIIVKPRQAEHYIKVQPEKFTPGRIFTRVSQTEIFILVNVIFFAQRPPVFLNVMLYNTTLTIVKGH